LREDYWHLDPYIRARSYYDRVGMINPGGKLQFYTEKTKSVTANGTKPVETIPIEYRPIETSANDVD